jgi:hypothetical protein
MDQSKVFDKKNIYLFTTANILSLFETFFKKKDKLECRNVKKKQKETLIEETFTYRPASNYQASLKKCLVHLIQQLIPELQIRNVYNFFAQFYNSCYWVFFYQKQSDD